MYFQVHQRSKYEQKIKESNDELKDKTSTIFSIQ